MRIGLIVAATVGGLAIFAMLEAQKNGRLSATDAYGAAVAVLVVIVTITALRRRQ